MGETFFVITDIHGCDKALKELLKYREKGQTLVFLGDAIDRGPDNAGVLKRLAFLRHALADKFIYLRGNHEQMFLDAIYYAEKEDVDLFLQNGGNETMYDLWMTHEHLARDFPTFKALMFDRNKPGTFWHMNFSEYAQLLEDTSFFYQTGKLLFTHAGFQSFYEDWTMTSENQYMWTRGHYQHENRSGLLSVFGHTPTSLIVEDNEKGDIYNNIENGYLGLDGGGVFGGQHHAVVLNSEGELLKQYSYVDKTETLVEVGQ